MQHDSAWPGIASVASMILPLFAERQYRKVIGDEEHGDATGIKAIAVVAPRFVLLDRHIFANEAAIDAGFSPNPRASRFERIQTGYRHRLT